MSHEIDDDLQRASVPHGSIVTELLRFARIVQQRKRVMVATMTLCGIIGTCYYTTAPRVYESVAQLLVLQTQGESLDTASQSSWSLQNNIPTYTSLISSDVVLKSSAAILTPEQRTDLQDTPEEDWHKELRKRLKATSPRGTNLIDISYQSSDPETAAATVNTIMTAYLKFMDRTHRTSSQELLSLLSDEKLNLEDQILVKEQELLNLQNDSAILSSGDQSVNVVVDRVVQLNNALVAAQQETLEARANYISVQEAIRKGEDLQQFAMTIMEPVAREMLGRRNGQDYAVGRIQEQLLDDKADLSNKLSVYGDAHPVVQELARRIQVAEQWLYNRQAMIVQEMRELQTRELAPMLLEVARQTVRKAEAHEASLREEFEIERQTALQLNSHVARIELHQLDLKRLRAFYDMLLERIKNLDLGKENSLKTAIVADPLVVREPVSPKRAKVGLFSLAGGFVLGLIMIYILDTLDDRFRSPDDLQEGVGCPILATIPLLESLDETGIASLHTYSRPNSTDAEAFRTLRTAISFSNGTTRRIVVSSTEPSDGKTTVMGNLSVAFAQTGRRVLLIDADMRRPGMSTLMQLRSAGGLSQVLRDTRPIDVSVLDNLHQSPISTFDVLPSGSRPMNPSELLQSDRFSDLLAWAEAHYDQVLVDAPPVLAVSDAAIISRLVDGVVLVVRPEKNRRRLVQRAAESFHSIDARLLGVVINGLTPQSDHAYGYGYSQGYGYGYGHDQEFDEDEASDHSGHELHPAGDQLAVSRPGDQTYDARASHDGSQITRDDSLTSYDTDRSEPDGKRRAA